MNRLPGLHTERFGRTLRHLAEVESTNSYLLQWAKEDAPHGAVVWADAQSQGRGRQGRRWWSGAGSGLYFSLLLKPGEAAASTRTGPGDAPLAGDTPPAGDAVPGGLASFSLVTALAVARALEECSGMDVDLKWPNDLWWKGRKVSGILLEGVGGAGGSLVTGVGVNLQPPSGGWPKELRDRAVSVAEATGRSPSAATVLAAILHHLEPSWDTFLREGFSAFHNEWERRDLLRGRKVWVEEGGGHSRVLQVEGVDEGGRLVTFELGEKRGRRLLVAGEVHLLGEAP